MAASKTIFVTGITGNQGGALAKYLRSHNHKVIGMSRNISSEKSIQLQKQGVTMIEGNLDNPETYKHELEKVDAVFLVQTLQGKQSEIKQGKQFISNLPSNKNLHVVYTSVLGADLKTGVPHFDSKYELENYIKSHDLKFTILRPASFYENHLFPQVSNGIKKGSYVSPLNRSCKQQMIGTDDIGKIGAQVISKGENYFGKTLSLATDELKIGEVPELFSKVLNKPVKYKKLPGLITRLAMGKDLSRMFKYMNKNDFSIVENIDNVRNEFGIEGNFNSWIVENFRSTS